MTASDTLRILIADDHEGYRCELRSTLARERDIDVVADASNGAAAILGVRALWPLGLDLVLMDIDMPIMNGIDATAEIGKIAPSLPVIILTVSALDRDLFAGVRSGAIGFLNKNLSPATLVRTLRDYSRNGSLPMSRAMASKVLSHLQHHQTPPPKDSGSAAALTGREQEVLQRIALGAHDREIAAALVLGETTIKTHVRNILRKLGARNRAEAVAHLRADEST